MELDDALIRRLETLAGLSCDPAEREALRRDLHLITEFVDRLEPLAAAAPPPAEPDGVPTLREDTPAAFRPPDAAPAPADGAFLCPPPREEG